MRASRRSCIGSGNRQDVFLFAVRHLHVFTAILGEGQAPGPAAGGGRLNVYDAIRSSVVQAATFRARKGKGAALSPGPPVLGIFTFGDPVRRDIVIFVLAGVVDYRANIKTQPATCQLGRRRTD